VSGSTRNALTIPATKVNTAPIPSPIRGAASTDTKPSSSVTTLLRRLID
jgi:hypothetical protein